MPRTVAVATPPVDTVAPGLELRLLGAPCLVVGERRIALSAKDAALLCLIALAGPIRPDRVATLLWPNAGAKQADTSLRQRLYRLRRDAGLRLLGGGIGLQLQETVHTDLAQGLAQIEHDEHAPLEELLGDLDFDELPELAEWLRQERRRWQEQCTGALAAAAARCEDEGAVARGLVYAQRLVERDPLAEHGQRRLMRLHYLRGDRAAAIATFERFEQRLKDELGTRPSAETIELLATIERGGAALPVRRATAPAGLLRPPRLIGRDRELQALAQAWASRRAFLRIGEAGIGKSRLLQEFCAGRTGVVGVQARPGDAGIAYAVLARLLRAVLAAHPLPLQPARTRELALVLPELGPAVTLAGAAQKLLLQRSVEATLVDALAHGLQALVVDDLHFADEASVEFLQSLLQAEALAALHWGFAQRPAEAGGAAERLRAALEEVARLETGVLQPLDLAQLADLVESIGLAELSAERLAPALLRHTGGNPLFALETLKDLVLSGDAAAIERGGRLPQPVTVGALVERRLGQLSSEALRLVRVAALARAGVQRRARRRRARGAPARHRRALARARVGAAAARRRLRPRPDLRGRARLGAAADRRLLHKRIALHLAARAVLPERTAPHWAGAGEWQRAGEAYAAAARRAQGASQRSHEVECWNQAAAAFDQAGAADAAFDARCESIHALIVVRGVTQANGRSRRCSRWRARPSSAPPR